jgi:predicted Zn-dependent protease
MTGLLEKAEVSWPVFRAEVRAALDAWERVAGITFEMVDDADEADILIGAQTEPRGRAFVNVAHAAAKGKGAGILSRSIVCLNPEQPWKVGFDGRLEVYDLRYTMTHEIGHAIGLNHPGPTGQVMAFTYQEEFRDPQPGDITGATMLYGPPVQR